MSQTYNLCNTTSSIWNIAASTQTLTCSTTQMRDNERAVLRYTFDGVTYHTNPGSGLSLPRLSCCTADAAQGCGYADYTTAAVGYASLARGLLFSKRLQRYLVAIGDLRVVGHCKP